jgi:hypothetical protein
MLVHSRRRCAAVQCGSRIRVRRRAERTQEHEQGRRGGGAARVEQELGRGAARRGRNQQRRHDARTQSIPSLKPYLPLNEHSHVLLNICVQFHNYQHPLRISLLKTCSEGTQFFIKRTFYSQDTFYKSR